MIQTWTTEKRLVAAVVVLLVVAIYAHTFASFVAGWSDPANDGENMHGWLVGPLTAFLIWMNWPRLRQIPIRGNPAAGLTVLGLALFVQVAGVWLGFNRSVGYSFVFAFAGLSLYFLGTEMTKALAFPLAFLLFMVPTPGGLIDEISSPLQRLSASAVQVICGFVGVNVGVSGVTLYFLAAHHLNGQPEHITLEVAQGCSGLHSLTAMAMLAAILAYFMVVPTRWKWGLFALALPVAMVGNVVRIFAVVMVANAQGQAAGEKFHDSTVGKLLPFLVAFLIVLGIGRYLEWRMAPKDTPSDDDPDGKPGGGPGQGDDLSAADNRLLNGSGEGLPEGGNHRDEKTALAGMKQ